MCTVAAGSWGGQRPSMGDYVTGTGAHGRGDRCPLPEGANVAYALTDAPQRHSANRGPRPLVSILLPLTSTNSTSPSTRYGPLGLMLILTAIEAPPHKV